MTHPIHQPTVEIINRALGLMDDFLRERIDLDIYFQKLNELQVDDLLENFQEEFKIDPRMIYYLDTLMLLSSLQHELAFQVAEYGASVATEDMKCLRELLDKLPYG